MKEIRFKIMTLSDIKSGSVTSLLWMFDYDYSDKELRFKAPFGPDLLACRKNYFEMNLSDVSYEDIKDLRLNHMSHLKGKRYASGKCNTNYYDALVDVYGEEIIENFIHIDPFNIRLKVAIAINSVMKVDKEYEYLVKVNRFDLNTDSDINRQIYNTIKENFNINKQAIDENGYQYFITSKED